MIIPDRIEPSPNVGSSLIPRGVIIHATRSGKSMNPTELEGTINWFKRDDVGLSAHWVIGRQGEKVRMVPDRVVAIHAGEHNATHVGIEVCQGVESDGFTDQQYAALAEIGRDYVASYRIPPVHLMAGFIGHEETPQGRRQGKSDPGRMFDWNRFIASLTPQEDIPEMKWLALEDKPSNVNFRSYLVWVDRDGFKSRLVANAEEHEALDESKVAGDLQFVSLGTLRRFGCSPDPVQ